MTVTVQQLNDKNTVQIAISQQFDYSLHQKFRDAYRNQQRSGTTFRINLSRATYMDSSALGMILLLKEHADKLTGSVVIEQPNDAVRKILAIANFNHFVTIEG